MDDDFLIFLWLLVLTLVATSPIAAVVAIVKTRNTRRELARLRERLDALETAETGTSTVPPTAPQPEPDSPFDPTPLTDTPGPGEPSPGEPTPAEPAEGAPAAPDEGAVPARPRPFYADVEWERWIGVRGAAVVGGGVLALAAILFFRHAFVQGWISHERRVLGGLTLGAASLVGAGFLRRREYRFTPNALEGAGIVALYASIWAAQERYHLISAAVSFPAMGAVTGLACVLALRNRSLLTALLGLIGGFATPLLLSTETDRPIALFGYVLLLDIGLCFVSHRGRWPVIGSLAMVGTLLMQGLWIFGRMEERVGLGLVIAGLFAVVFLVAGLSARKESRASWVVAQLGSILGAFVFAFYFATHDETLLRGELWPTGLLLALLNVTASVTARIQTTRNLQAGAAVASFFVCTVWFFHADKTTIEPFWSLTAAALVLLSIPHLVARYFSPDEDTARQGYLAATSASIGWTLLFVVASACLNDLEPWAPTAGSTVLLGFWILQGHRLGRSLAWVGGLGLGLGWNLTVTADFLVGPDGLFGAGAPMDERLVLGLPAVLAVGLVTWGFLRRDRGRALHHAAACLLASFTLPLPLEADLLGLHLPWLGALSALLYGATVVAASLGTRRASLMALGSLLSAYLLHVWREELLDEPRSEEVLLQGLLWVCAAPLVLASLPLLRAHTYRRPWAPGMVAALFLTFLYLPAWSIFRERFGDLGYAMGVEWIVFAIGTCLALLAREGLERTAELDSRRRLGWLAGASALFLAGGLANLFDGVSEGAIVLALYSVALAAIGRRLDLAAPPYLALLSSSLAFTTLFVVFLDDAEYQTSGAPIGAWISYFHLLPALCFFLVARLNSPAPGSDQGPLAQLRRTTRIAPSLACILTLFLWINLVVSDFYETRTRIRFFSDRPPEQDLALSIAWGLYAVLLLSLGIWSRQSGLRWTSLALFVVTLGKVFLHDLGHLEGLYRVGSLAGLALALIFVSIFYQRFVFRSPRAAGGDGA